MESITVYIADVSEILRSGIKHLLMQSDRIGTILSFPDANSLVESFQTCPEAVCIISSNLSDMNLKDLLNKLKKINENVKAVIISGNATIGNVNLALNMGAKGYITRQASAKELEEIIYSVWNEKQAFSQSVSDTIVGYYANSHKPGSSLKKQKLTNREREILKYIVDGLTSSEIADRLFISTRTVETHRANLMQKLNIKNTAALVRYALEEREQF
ncbi:response regulator transcription factor [Rhodohalobacter sp. 8-1]|uniref:response regulator transcription factor n=1 Tax=Rhodohalobacter sp. 8-1 TaxID=3131972 RepID=UPI0030EEE968